MVATLAFDEVRQAVLIGGPAAGARVSVGIESTGFPPPHVVVTDADGVTDHVYGMLLSDEAATLRFGYLGPLRRPVPDRRRGGGA
jgi:hypothetical protein